MAVTKTRKLTDLFRVGTEFTVDDGNGAVEVYLAKLNPVQSETAIRKANATRAKFLSTVRDKEGEDYLSIANEVYDLDKESLVLYAASESAAKKVDAWQSEFIADSEWLKDDYLQGLFDLWNGDENEPGLEKIFNEGEEGNRDPEAQRVFDEVERYENEVATFIDKERSHIEEEMNSLSLDQLRDLITETMIRVQADMTWMIEYRKCEVWLGTYTATQPRKPYFATRGEVDELEAETLTRLISGMGMLNVEVDEGKDLPLTEDSSLLSEPLKILETEEFSVLEESTP